MKLMDIINPWRRIAQLEERNSALWERCEELIDRANEAEALAFRRASEHYFARSRMVEEQLKATHERMATIASVTPITLRYPTEHGPRT